MKNKAVLGGSIIAAIAASFCCMGPLLAVILGIGTFGAATTFAAARPYLLAVTAVLLAGAFYLTYRKREVACEDGTCTVRTASRASKIALWMATVIVIVFAAFPYYSGALLRSDSPKNPPILPVAAPGPNAARSHDARATIAVDGMTCAGCAQRVRLALAKVRGVKSAEVFLKDRRAVVIFDPSATNPDKLQNAIKEIGYKTGEITLGDDQTTAQKPGASPGRCPIDQKGKFTMNAENIGNQAGQNEWGASDQPASCPPCRLGRTRRAAGLSGAALSLRGIA